MKIYLVALSTNNSYKIITDNYLSFEKAFLSKTKAINHCKKINRLYRYDDNWHYNVNELEVEK